MPRETKELGARKVESLTKQPGLHALGNNLYLRVTLKTGRTAEPGETTASYVLRYMLGRESRAMGLGSYRKVRLATARERALDALEQKTDGNDPLDARKASRATKRAADAKAITFKTAAGKYIEAHSAGWKNPKHAAQWSATLETYVYPTFGDLPVAAIDKAHVCAVLDPIWQDKTETANRVRGRVEAVLNWATSRGYREGDNPARWRGHLEHTFPARAKVQKVEHHPALPYAGIGAFMENLRGHDGISAVALQFTILTAARTGEAIAAKWSEIDFDQALWTVPAARMKAGCEHRVPLSSGALAILRARREASGSQFVFPGSDPRKPLSNMAMLKFLKEGMSRPDLTVHGFRSTFRDWAGESTNFARDVIELALAHIRIPQMSLKRRFLVAGQFDF